MSTPPRDSETNSAELEVPTLDVCILDKAGIPITLPPADHEEFFTNLIKAIACTMNKMSILTDEQEEILNLDKVNINGDCYSLATDGNDKIEQGVRDLLEANHTRDYQDLSCACIFYLEKVAELVTKRSIDVEFSSTGISGITLTRVGASSSFDLPAEQLFSDETELYGKLLAVDLEQPRIKLEISEDQILDIAVSRKIANSLKAKQNKKLVY